MVRAELLWEIEQTAPEVVESLKELEPSAWAAEWFSGSEWAVRQAKRTKEFWLIFPASRERVEFARYGGRLYMGLGVPRRSEFTYKPWDPNRETERNFRVRLISEFKARLEQEIQEQRDRAPQPSIPALKNLHRDCEWLVLYHFKRQSFAQIVRDIEGRLAALNAKPPSDKPAEKESDNRPELVSIDAVSLAVRNLASIVELKLRTPDPAGRLPRQDL